MGSKINHVKLIKELQKFISFPIYRSVLQETRKVYVEVTAEEQVFACINGGTWTWEAYNSSSSSICINRLQFLITVLSQG